MVPRPGRGRGDGGGRHGRPRHGRAAAGRRAGLVCGLPGRQGARRPEGREALRLRQPRLPRLPLRRPRREAPCEGGEGERVRSLEPRPRAAQRPGRMVEEDLPRGLHAPLPQGDQGLHVPRPALGRREGDGDEVRQLPVRRRAQGLPGRAREGARPEEAVLLLPAPAPEGHVLRPVGVGARRRPRHEGPLGLSERGGLLGPLALLADGRALDLAGRLHVRGHELATRASPTTSARRSATRTPRPRARRPPRATRSR